MPTFQPGLAHAPVVPFKNDQQIDYDAYARVVDFHINNGADSLAVIMHSGESVSLTDAEQRKLIELTVQQAKGRAKVMAHTSDSGTAIAADRARFAEKAGAAAIVATTPYYWTPPPAMVIEHLAQIGAATKLPYYIFYTPDEMPGTKITVDTVLKLIDRLPNFAGVIDYSRDWQFMVNVHSSALRKRPDFQLISGTEYMVSAGALGATGLISSLSGVAPKMVRKLYDACRKEQYFEIRPLQEQISALRQAVKMGGVAGLKGAMRAMGRACGDTRAPNDPLRDFDGLNKALQGVAALADEPRGW